MAILHSSKFLAIAGMLFFINILQGQQVSWPLRDQVLQAFSGRTKAPAMLPFREIISNRDNDVESYTIPQQDWYAYLKNENEPVLSLEINVDGKDRVCDLIPVDLDCHHFTENATKIISNINVPLTYQGIIRGEEKKNNVILTVFSSGLSLTMYTPDKTLSVYSKPDTASSVFATAYGISDQRDWHVDEVIDMCGTKDVDIPIKQEIQTGGSRHPGDYCIYVFVECFDSLWAFRDSSYFLTVDMVYELFNHVHAAFANEQLNVKISHINVWTSADPYNTPNRETALANLSAFYQDNYWGNICVGLDYSINATGRSGLAGDIGRVKGAFPNVCPMYTSADHTFCYNDLDYNVNVNGFPAGPVTTEDQVYLVTHEIGHLLGSSHTQWCGWVLGPGMTGALDNCAAVEPAGGCAPGPDPPPGGGTIMSYCVSGAESTNFNNGFGPLPGAAIRNFVDGNSCISLCPSCPVTPEINFTEISVPGVVYNFESAGTITATGVLTSSEMAVLDAEYQVKLTPGFHAEAGAIFKAFIEGCGGIR